MTIGCHKIIGEHLSEDKVLSIIISSLAWQEENGPMVCQCDESFYDLLFNNGMEDLYQDYFPDAVPFEVMEVDPFGPLKNSIEANENFVDLQSEQLPEQYRLLWPKVASSLNSIKAMGA